MQKSLVTTAGCVQFSICGGGAGGLSPGTPGPTQLGGCPLSSAGRPKSHTARSRRPSPSPVPGAAPVQESLCPHLEPTSVGAAGGQGPGVPAGHPDIPDMGLSLLTMKLG